MFTNLLTVCNQFSRGVFAMMGAVSPDSFDTLHSYSNTFQMPFVTPWFPEKVSLHPSFQKIVNHNFVIVISDYVMRNSCLISTLRLNLIT